MADKKSFIMYKSWIPMLEDLDDEDLGKLMKAVCAYQMGNEYDLPKYLKAIFQMIKATFQEDDDRYAARCAKNSEIATAREEQKRTRSTTNVHEEARTCTNSTESESDSDSESESEKDNKTSCSVHFAPEPEADVEAVVLTDGTEWRPTVYMYEEYKRLYPGVDIDGEFRKIRAWCLGNEKKRKTKRGVKAFVSSWLSRAQDRPQTSKPNAPPVKKNAFNSFSDQHDYNLDDLARSLSQPMEGIWNS